MVNLELWRNVLKLKINSFRDNSKKECWVFYRKDLEKLLKPKPLTKKQREQRNRMYASMIKTLKETDWFKDYNKPTKWK